MPMIGPKKLRNESSDMGTPEAEVKMSRKKELPALTRQLVKVNERTPDDAYADEAEEQHEPAASEVIP